MKLWEMLIALHHNVLEPVDNAVQCGCHASAYDEWNTYSHAGKDRGQMSKRLTGESSDPW